MKLINHAVEKGLLCACLENPKVRAYTLPKLKEQYFGDELNREVWDLLVYLSENSKPIPSVRLLCQNPGLSADAQGALKTELDLKRLKRYRGYRKADVDDAVETLSHFHQKRQLYELEKWVADKLSLPSRVPIKKIKSHIQNTLDGLTKYDPTRIAYTLGDGAAEYIATLERNLARGLTPVATMLPKLDRLLGGGLGWGQVAILCGPPGTGKSSTALNWGIEYAQRTHKPVIFASLEMSSVDVYSRLVCGQRDLAWNAVCAGEHLGECKQVLTELTSVPFIVTSPKNTQELVEDTITVANHHGCPPLVIIDYVQQLAARGRMDARQALECASNDILRLANDHLVSVLALSSVPRDKYSPIRNGKPDLDTMLRMARETGQLEFDASVVMGLARPVNSDPFAACQQLWLGVPKNRKGQVGYVACEFNGQAGTLTEVALEDMPAERTKLTREELRHMILELATTNNLHAMKQVGKTLRDQGYKVSHEAVSREIKLLLNQGELVKSNNRYVTPVS